jgi:hypothetical protein
MLERDPIDRPVFGRLFEHVLANMLSLELEHFLRFLHDHRLAVRVQSKKA